MIVCGGGYHVGLVRFRGNLALLPWEGLAGPYLTPRRPRDMETMNIGPSPQPGSKGSPC